MTNADYSEEPIYEVVISEEAEVNIDAIYDWLFIRDPNFAASLRGDLRRVILSELPNFPGPLSHSIDQEATELYGIEIRRLLYKGPKVRRVPIAYRVLFTLLPPRGGEGETIIRVLRILHGSQSLVPPGASED